jgi:transposase InsO family protein
LILTCLTFRAVHIEMLRDMSTAQVLMAFRRFFSSRGKSRCFYSDNGKNFVGAANILHKDLKEMKAVLGEEIARQHKIDWKFMPAYSPWFGGAWERLIQSIKKCVEFMLKGEILHDDVLETALKDASFLMNRRPLTHVPIDHEDAKPLTPNTAMFGDEDDDCAIAAGVFTSSDANSTSRYRRAQHFTIKYMTRWVREYLPEINRREKWNERTRPIKLDDIVIVIEPNEPRNAWKKGRVIKTHPGPDGEIRAVDVRLGDGTVRPSRSVGRLAVLDVAGESTDASELTSLTGGGMSLHDATSN